MCVCVQRPNPVTARYAFFGRLTNYRMVRSDVDRTLHNAHHNPDLVEHWEYFAQFVNFFLPLSGCLLLHFLAPAPRQRQYNAHIYTLHHRLARHVCSFPLREGLRVYFTPHCIRRHEQPVGIVCVWLGCKARQSPPQKTPMSREKHSRNAHDTQGYTVARNNKDKRKYTQTPEKIARKQITMRRSYLE
jgi:hypothetical protein